MSRSASELVRPLVGRTVNVRIVTPDGLGEGHQFEGVARLLSGLEFRHDKLEAAFTYVARSDGRYMLMYYRDTWHVVLDSLKDRGVRLFAKGQLKHVGPDDAVD